MTVMRFAACVAALLFSVPAAALAAQDGELWEMTMEMSMPGIPAGMGKHTSQQCQGKDWRTPPGGQSAGKEQCTISEYEHTATRVTYKATCSGNPPTQVSMDLSFEENRSRMKGTMRVESRDGSMLTKLSGRRIGTCDAAQAGRERQAALAKNEALSRDMARQQQAARGMQRQQQAAMRDANAATGRKCTAALDAMDVDGWPDTTAPLCYNCGLPGSSQMCPADQKADLLSSCREWASSDTTGCFSKFPEFCRRFQTQEGFEKTSDRAQASLVCGVPLEPLVTRFCPGALEHEAMDLLREHCPAEEKILAQMRCHGPDYSWSNSLGPSGQHKYYNLCTGYCMNADCDSPRAVRAAGQPPEEKKPAERAGEALNQGLNKLKGLFGR